MDDPKLTYTASLVNLPKITFSDVHRITEQHSITARSKVDKGYGFFFENFIYDYEDCFPSGCSRTSRNLMQLYSRQGSVQPSSSLVVPECPFQHVADESCTSTCVLHKLYANMASTKDKEPVQDLVVREPKPSTRSVCKSTLYQAYTGSLPDPQVLSLGKRLKHLRPQPLISSVLHDLSQLSMVDSRFGPVPRGSPLSYQCPPVVKRENYVQHPDAPTFPKLPLEGSTFPTTFLNFDQNSQQFLHLDSLTVTHEMAAEREEQTREQSECPLWQLLRQA
ncbi:hypothetical protein UPYG_G00077200 [Umbra pygmaea]|uniref:Uncharacterized protein n=1 Tax=Umbra pygmaea TaxID=75934 RepID=A0ABD0XDF7_UMBPY